MYLLGWTRLCGRFIRQNIWRVEPYNYMKVNIVREPPGNANLPIGAFQDANREIGVPRANSPNSGRLHGKRLAPNERDLHPNG